MFPHLLLQFHCTTIFFCSPQTCLIQSLPCSWWCVDGCPVELTKIFIGIVSLVVQSLPMLNGFFISTFFFFSSSFIFSLMNLFFFFDSLIAFLNSTDHSSFTRLCSLIFRFDFMIPHQLLNFVAMEPVCSCVGLSDELVVLYFVRFLSCVCCVAGVCEHGMVFESI